MSTIVLLSSSPPRVFARSPTPADSSSPLPSTAALLQGSSPGRNKFKTKTKPRDGFPKAFSTARQVLAEKNGAENTMIGSPGKHRFRSSQDDVVEDKADKESNPALRRPQILDKAKSSSDVLAAGEQQVEKWKAPVKVFGESPVREGTDKSETQKNQSLESVSFQSVIARKTDWKTPKPQHSREMNEKQAEHSGWFMNDILRDPKYADTHTNLDKPSDSATPNPAKRRCIAPVHTLNSDINIPIAPKLVKAHSMPAQPTLPKRRSPTKKALTITALATSNYLGVEEAKETPMMQYLTSTQAQLEDTSNEPGLATKIQKTKTAVQKLKQSKKRQQKSSLLSPESAIKTYNAQEAIFGSASQLARDESPTFLRETIEAMKESESFLMSDPFSSPQRTQPISVENTPKTGTSRFRKTRNLWSAAGRDEDNALLHVDIVDLTDTPAIRNAFMGKDVLVQPTTKPTSFKHGLQLRGGFSPLTKTCVNNVFDMNSITATPMTSVRAVSTSVKPISPTKASNTILEEAETRMEPPEPKPNYAGFTIHELNKVIKSYGFKAMRKREKMIELLDRCWEEQHGLQKPEQDEPEPAPFGDFLDKVHDVSARPEPKVKKARVQKKQDGIEQEPKEKPVKRPRQRKKKEPESGTAECTEEKPKIQRKRKPKSMGITEGVVHNVDDILATIPKELLALERVEEWAKPEKKPKTVSRTPATVKAQIPPSTTSTKVDDRSDPSNSLPGAALPDLSTMPKEKHAPLAPSPQTKIPDPETTNSPSDQSTNSQITAAIMYQSQYPQPGRNHNINPTWHEKILLYDPIILEDLAAWLNTEGLGVIGEDSEISAIQVREWCESQGICCLWRGGWRGNKAAQQ